MARVTLYLDKATHKRMRDAAALRKVSQSQFVVGLVRKATLSEWPPEVLALMGSVPDFPLAEELRAGLPPDLPRPEW
jgi:hypothetical protein